MNIKLLILMISLFHYNFALANAGVSGIDSKIASVIGQLPQSEFKKSLETYIETLGLKKYSDSNAVGQANFGIRGYFEKKFSEDNCFAKIAFDFYREIRKVDSGLRRPGLTDQAGTGNFKQHKPGWVFDLALKYTSGDSRKAIELIGLCGHDDVAQGDYRNAAVEDEFEKRGLGEAELFNWDESYDGYKLCPPKASDFYLQGGLSKDTVLNSSMVERVLKKQSAGQSIFIPSKYYHVMASAFLTCQLVEGGMPGQFAQALQVSLAEQYRGIRLCASIEKDLSIYQQVLASSDFDELLGQSEKDRSLIKKLQDLLRSRKCEFKTYDSEELCPILAMTVGNVNLQANNNLNQLDSLDKKIEKFVYRSVAAGLYHKWFVSYQISGVSQCTKVPLVTLPIFISKLTHYFNYEYKVCGAGLSAIGCRKAIEEIESWLVDFDWTATQHAMGADFAIKHCTKRKPEAGVSWCGP